MQTVLGVDLQLLPARFCVLAVLIHARRTVPLLRPGIGWEVDHTGDARVAQPEVGGLVVVMVSPASEQRGGDVEADLPIRLGILPGGALGGWAQSLMVWVPVARTGENMEICSLTMWHQKPLQGGERWAGLSACCA